MVDIHVPHDAHGHDRMHPWNGQVLDDLLLWTLRLFRISADLRMAGVW